MRTTVLVWAIAGGVVTALLVWLVITYNRLIRLRNAREDAWSGIDVQLTRRADLVPNLVETVRGYAAHERDTLQEVTDARAAMVAATGPREAGRADDALENALGRLFAVAEAYPDLKASTNFLELQRQLALLEEDVAFARRYHNAIVERFNTAQQTLPTVLVARPLGFEPAEFFKADAEDRAVPDVELPR